MRLNPNTYTHPQLEEEFGFSELFGILAFFFSFHCHFSVRFFFFCFKHLHNLVSQRSNFTTGKIVTISVALANLWVHGYIYGLLQEKCVDFFDVFQTLFWVRSSSNARKWNWNFLSDTKQALHCALLARG